MPTAFSGPLKLQERIGALTPRIAALDPARSRRRSGKPAIHRFPGAMARRCRSCARSSSSTAVGRSACGRRRPTPPTCGGGSARCPAGDEITGLGSVLALRFGVEAAQGSSPSTRASAGSTHHEALLEYQAAKRAHKAALRAAPTA